MLQTPLPPSLRGEPAAQRLFHASRSSRAAAAAVPRWRALPAGLAARARRRVAAVRKALVGPAGRGECDVAASDRAEVHGAVEGDPGVGAAGDGWGPAHLEWLEDLNGLCWWVRGSIYILYIPRT